MKKRNTFFDYIDVLRERAFRYAFMLDAVGMAGR